MSCLQLSNARQLFFDLFLCFMGLKLATTLAWRSFEHHRVISANALSLLVPRFK
jgi:hypothetical protein